MTKLTDKQRRFAEAYALTLDLPTSLKAAGYQIQNYKPGDLNKKGRELLEKPAIAQAVQQAAAAGGRRIDVSKPALLAALARIVWFDIAELVDDDGRIRKPADIPPELRTAIEVVRISEGRDGQVQYEYRIGSKVKAAELMAKVLGITSHGNTAPQRPRVRVRTVEGPAGKGTEVEVS